MCVVQFCELLGRGVEIVFVLHKACFVNCWGGGWTDVCCLKCLEWQWNALWAVQGEQVVTTAGGTHAHARAHTHTHTHTHTPQTPRTRTCTSKVLARPCSSKEIRQTHLWSGACVLASLCADTCEFVCMYICMYVCVCVFLHHV